ncbi:MAG: rhodanese-like domain-containing protein [Syntrophales bacterium]
MKIKVTVAALLPLILLSLAGGSGCLAATQIAPDEGEICLIAVQDVPRMSVDELKARLNGPSLIIIDVRAPGDWNGSSTKIKGAYREVLEKIEEWAPRYDKEKAVVLYCS